MEAFERRAEELELRSVMSEESLQGVQVPSHLLRVYLYAGAGPYLHSRAACHPRPKRHQLCRLVPPSLCLNLTYELGIIPIIVLALVFMRMG